MTEPLEKLSRQAASEAVGDLGWRYLLGTLRTSVPTGSLARAAEAAARAVAVCGPAADRHLRADLRPGRAVLTLGTFDLDQVSVRDAELARAVTTALRENGLRTEPETGAGPGGRSVQQVELAIDALDIPAVLPFWRAVLGYTDAPADGGPVDAVVDPVGQGPAVWFQQMDEARPHRNRVHVDVCVPHDEAAGRIAAALAAGGRLLSDAAAPAFWVLADPEGNEACVTTWQGRDPAP